MIRGLRSIVLLAGWCLAGSLWACDVPVFRFALERWYTDSYRLAVTPGQKGELSEEEASVLQVLSKATEPDSIAANLTVTTQPKGENQAAAARLDLRYPQKAWGAPESPPLWSGAATRANAQRILDSPLRRELTKRLLAGESAIWLIVESGNQQADRKTEETLLAASAEAKKEISISEEVVPRDEMERGAASLPVDPENLLRAPVPLKIDFSVLRVSRTDPNEQLLLAMLLHVEEDLAKYATEPMVFPVFGRGRFLEPLIGAGINRDNVLQYAAYLCGACSCQVKDQNPGMDLLISAAWDAVLDGSEVVIDKVLPPLEGVAALLGEKPAAKPEKSISPTAPAPEAPRGLRFPVMLAAVLGAVMLVVALATALLLLRARRKP